MNYIMAEATLPSRNDGHLNYLLDPERKKADQQDVYQKFVNEGGVYVMKLIHVHSDRYLRIYFWDLVQQ